MPFPADVDQQIRKQFVSILNRTAGIATDDGLYIQLRIELFALMHRIDANSMYFQKLRDEIDKLPSGAYSTLAKYVRALDKSYQAGMFDTAVQAVEARITANYLAQAESLLSDAGNKKYDHI